jgi:L-asparaginase
MAQAHNKKRVLLLHTGGTLGMVGGDPSPLHPERDVDAVQRALLQRVPELTDLAELSVEILARQDSCDVTGAQWLAWAERIRADRWAEGIVLIHGTDTMAYTAGALSFLLEERSRPVVLTGSQRPLSAVRSDARQNLVDAVIVACGPVREVMVSFSGMVLRGNRTLKRSSTSMGAMNAFESPNCPPLCTMGVDIRWSDHALRQAGELRRLRLGDAVRMSWVLPDLAAPPPWLPSEPAVHVLCALGSGNFPLHAGWLELVQREAAVGVTHLVVSQCPHGGVSAGLYESSQRLIEEGALYGADLTFAAAVTKARVGLGQGFSPDELRAYLGRCVAGELTAIDPRDEAG